MVVIKRVDCTNKRSLGPWVAHLRMTVYKVIRDQSSSQSQTMSFDRSVVSLRPNMGYVDKINRIKQVTTNKTSDIWGGAIFWPPGAKFEQTW